MSFGQGGKRNFCVNFISDRNGDVVLLKRDSEQNKWAMTIIEELMPGYNGISRSLKLRIRKSNRDDQNQILEKLVHKIVLLF